MQEEKKEKTPKKEKVSKDQLKIEKLELEVAELKDKNLRLMAEMQNVGRRYSEELARISKRDGEGFIKDLLPVIDNFERAIKMDNDNLEDELSKFLEGFKMVYANMIASLNNKGVHEIECLHKPFDPNTMEAVLTDHIDGHDKGEVIDVLQKGYMYNDILLRPAMVKVND